MAHRVPPWLLVAEIAYGTQHCYSHTPSMAVASTTILRWRGSTNLNAGMFSRFHSWLSVRERRRTLVTATSEGLRLNQKMPTATTAPSPSASMSR